MKNALFVLFVLGLILLSGCGGNKDAPSGQVVNEELNKQITTPSESPEVTRLKNAKNALEDLKKTTDAYSKVNECAKLCAREDKDIPYVLDQCRIPCQSEYYYGGDEALDELMKEFKNSS